MAEIYQQQDALNTLYDGTALTADGNSTAIDFGMDGACPDGELIFTIGTLATGDTITLILEDYISAAYVNQPLQLRAIAAAGVYVVPINNKVITGSRLRIEHDVTLATGNDVTVHGHFRPFN